MLLPGVYPASITPCTPLGEVDTSSLARLLAWFEASGCAGVVLAGTNGEGPSLSAMEKRDLVRAAMPLRGKLEVILGIATCSLDEARWLCKQAHRDGAAAALVMAPFYFREAGEEGIARWFEELMDVSMLPIIVYNFPQRTGVKITPETLHWLSRHERFLGVKDSSGNEENLCTFRQAVGSGVSFVGDETLLVSALRNGWSGSISGGANVLPQWLSQIVSEWETDPKSAEAKFNLALPAIKRLRECPQPMLNKALLASYGIIESGLPRLPLLAACKEEIIEVQGILRETLGIGGISALPGETGGFPNR